MSRSSSAGGSGRGRERFLLVLSLLTVAIAYAGLQFAPQSSDASTAGWAPLGWFAAIAIAAHGVLSIAGFRGDQRILPAAMLLAGLGVVVQTRLGAYQADTAARWSNLALPAGVAAMLAVALLFRGGRIRMLAAAAIPASLAAAALLAGMLLAGQRFRGGVFVHGMNPAELVKVLLAIYLAAFFASDENGSQRGNLFAGSSLAKLAAFWGLPMALLVLQHDLGMMLLLAGVFMIVLTFSTGRIGVLLLLAGVAAVAGYALLKFMPHGMGRLEVWADPFADPTGKGWQILQSLAALYSGGLTGTGFGAGHPQNIPIASSDFAYAAFGEEAGLAGCALLLAVFLALFYAGFRIADASKSPFGKNLAATLTSTLAFQALINVGGVTKALPLTGITLPFVSHGGSSLVASFVALGLLLALSDEADGGRGKSSAKKK